MGMLGDVTRSKENCQLNRGNLRELTSLYEKVTALWQRFVFQLTCFFGSLIVSVALMTRIDTGNSKEFTFTPTPIYKPLRLPFFGFERYCLTKDLLNNRENAFRKRRCGPARFAHFQRPLPLRPNNGPIDTPSPSSGGGGTLEPSDELQKINGADTTLKPRILYTPSRS